MAFKCCSCKKTYDNAKIAGIVIGQIAEKKLIANGLAPANAVNISSSMIASKLSSGIISGFGIKCPNCGKNDWD